MKLIVHDACTLIDLIEGDLLGPWPALGYDACTSDLVVREITVASQKNALNKWVAGENLTVETLSAEELAEAISLQQTLGAGLTLADTSALYLAKKHSAILLSGDGALRKQGQRAGLAVHGTIWILDKLVEKRYISCAGAVVRLMALLKSGSRFPQEECRKRMEMWSKGKVI